MLIEPEEGYNPLTIDALYRSAGFSVRRICSAYIHPTPPRVMPAGLPAERFARAHAAHARSWQGLFTGSQFLVVAQKDPPPAAGLSP